MMKASSLLFCVGVIVLQLAGGAHAVAGQKAWSRHGPGAVLGSNDFRIFLTEFAGPGETGRNVSTVINLSLWRTLRIPPKNLPNRPNYANGIIRWGDEPLAEQNPDEAGRALKISDDDLILWGAAQPYGDGVIVQSYLLTRTPVAGDAPGGAIWEITLPQGRIALGLPRNLFEFGAVALRPSIVEKFTLPSALTYCPTKTIDCKGAPVGNAMRALAHDGAWTQVGRPGNPFGWVYVDEIGQEPNEIVAFTGGLIAYYRGDFKWAQAQFAQAARLDGADPLVREDAALLAVAARSRLGVENASVEIDAVRDANPWSRYALQIAVMDAFQAIQQGRPGGVKRLADLAEDLEYSRRLFADDDLWFAQAEQLITALAADR